MTTYLHRTAPFAIPVRAIAVFAGLHGIAHLAGTSDSFAKAAEGGSVEYLGGGWTISDPVLLRILGVAWAVLGALFVAAAVVTWLGQPRWPRMLAAASAASLVLVSVALWSSVIGVAVDLLLLGYAVHSAHAT